MSANSDDLVWLRPAYCETNGCVEVAITATDVLVRNSATPETISRFSKEEWADFIASARDGIFDAD